MWRIASVFLSSHTIKHNELLSDKYAAKTFKTQFYFIESLFEI